MRQVTTVIITEKRYTVMVTAKELIALLKVPASARLSVRSSGYDDAEIDRDSPLIVEWSEHNSQTSESEE